MVRVLMTKPVVDRLADPPFVDYDSEESLSADEEENGLDDERSITEMEDEVTRSGARQHSDGQSYSWALLRLVIIKAATRVVQQILTTVSLDTQDLPVASPALHLTLKTLDNWQSMHNVLQNLSTWIAKRIHHNLQARQDYFFKWCTLSVFLSKGCAT